MMTLRETNIREQTNESCYFQPSNLRSSAINNTNHSSAFLARDKDCCSPYTNNLSGSREINSKLRDSVATINQSQRVLSSRFLSNSIDQRILKQSTEDCRRLLQQATAIAENRLIHQSIGNNAMEVNQCQQSQQQQLTTPTTHHHPNHHHHHHRGLTSSNSFDSTKSNLPAASFQMSSEATRLFNTLQQSPLPLISDVSVFSLLYFCFLRRERLRRLGPEFRRLLIKGFPLHIFQIPCFISHLSFTILTKCLMIESKRMTYGSNHTIEQLTKGFA